MPTRHPSDDADLADDDFDADTAVAEDDTEEPGDTTFWRAYNRNLEFPIATLLSVFAHLTLVAVLVGIILLSMSGAKDKSAVPITLVDNGFDDTGSGNQNGGGDTAAITNGDNAPTQADRDQLPNLDQLPELKERVEKDLALDGLADTSVSDEKLAPIAGLGEELQKKLANFNKPKGGGGTGPAGPGGSGPDETRARSLRWVMRFQITSGREYLNQLGGLGAVVVIPIPPSNKSAYVYKDLSGASRGELMSDGEWTQLAQKVQFCDYKRDVVQQVTRELHAPVDAHAFWAFFPTSLEKLLADKETAYQGKKSSEIAETVFQVRYENGRYDMVVVRQTLKN